MMNNSLWESRITPKESTSQSPYSLVYGKEWMPSINIKINALSMAFQIEDLDQSTPLQFGDLELMQLKKYREKEIVAIENRQLVSKINFD